MDLDRLSEDMGMADETTDDAMHSVCEPELQDTGEVWGWTYEPSPKKPAIHPVKN
jgi:hypothetical protein